MLLYLIRHAESVSNAAGRVQGHSDVALSDRGRRQAEALAAALGRLPIEAIYASPLRRAVETAQPLAAVLGLPIRTDPRLMEINAGVFQDHLRRELDLLFPADYARWKSGDPDFVVPGGESRRQLTARAKEAFDAIETAGHAQAVVVSHGGLIGAGLKALLEIPAWRNPFVFENASISRLEREQNQVRLLSLNEVEHLREAGLAGTGDF